MSTSSETDIVGGIEWFEFSSDPMSPPSIECQCARCGSSCDWLNCSQCGGEGEVEYREPDSYDDEEDTRPCSYCGGDGGSWHCDSTPELCTANPLKGREAIASTALSTEAWRD